MQVSNIRFALLALLLLTRCGPGADEAATESPAPQTAGTSTETIRSLVARLDLERYKATIKGLTNSATGFTGPTATAQRSIGSTPS